MLHRRLKLFISCLFFVSLATRRWARALVGANGKRSLTTLLYHSVTDKGRESFANQMHWLRSLAVPVALDTDLNGLNQGSYCTVTFDDGLEDTLAIVIPILIREHVPTAIFVPTRLVGSKATWLQNDCCRIGDKVVAAGDRLRGLPGDLFIIGSHTQTHARLTSLTQEELWKEIRGSLEDSIGVRPHLPSVSGISLW